MNTPFRFWGNIDPRGRAKPEVVNFADVAVADGVATMRLYDPVDSWGGEFGVSAKEFAAALDSLPDDTSEIRLHINSPGGEVYEGLAILNQLRAHEARVVAVVDGIAASAASFIAAGADELVMSRNSQLMIHDAWGLCVGNAANMRDLADRLDKISDNIASVYASKAPKGDWRAAMLAESWFDADEAVTAGLADRVEGVADKDAKNRFDLSIFQHAGREDAPTPDVPPAGCTCGHDGQPLLLVGCDHKRECPDKTTNVADEPSGISALMERRHRMNARRFQRSA